MATTETLHTWLLLLDFCLTCTSHPTSLPNNRKNNITCLTAVGGVGWGGILGWKVHRLTLIFPHSLPAVHTFHPVLLQCLDSCGKEAPSSCSKKFLNSRYDLIIGPIVLHSQVLETRWCQIRSQFGGKLTGSKPQSGRRRLVLVKPEPLRQFSELFWLECLGKLV